MGKKTTMGHDEAVALVASRGLDTRDKALDARVALDITRWGDGERDASRKQHGGRSHALLLNSIAVADVDHIDEELKAAAAALMTEDDRAWLRKGG